MEVARPDLLRLALDCPGTQDSFLSAWRTTPNPYFCLFICRLEHAASMSLIEWSNYPTLLPTRIFFSALTDVKTTNGGQTLRDFLKKLFCDPTADLDSDNRWSSSRDLKAINLCENFQRIVMGKDSEISNPERQQLCAALAGYFAETCEPFPLWLLESSIFAEVFAYTVCAEPARLTVLIDELQAIYLADRKNMRSVITASVSLLCDVSSSIAGQLMHMLHHAMLLPSFLIDLCHKHEPKSTIPILANILKHNPVAVLRDFETRGSLQKLIKYLVHSALENDLGALRLLVLIFIWKGPQFSQDIPIDLPFLLLDKCSATCSSARSQRERYIACLAFASISHYPKINFWTQKLNGDASGVETLLSNCTPFTHLGLYCALGDWIKIEQLMSVWLNHQISLSGSSQATKVIGANCTGSILATASMRELHDHVDLVLKLVLSGAYDCIKMDISEWVFSYMKSAKQIELEAVDLIQLFVNKALCLGEPLPSNNFKLIDLPLIYKHFKSELFSARTNEIVVSEQFMLLTYYVCELISQCEKYSASIDSDKSRSSNCAKYIEIEFLNMLPVTMALTQSKNTPLYNALLSSIPCEYRLLKQEQFENFNFELKFFEIPSQPEILRLLESPGEESRVSFLKFFLQLPGYVCDIIVKAHFQQISDSPAIEISFAKVIELPLLLFGCFQCFTSPAILEKFSKIMSFTLTASRTHARLQSTSETNDAALRSQDCMFIKMLLERITDDNIDIIRSVVNLVFQNDLGVITQLIAEGFDRNHVKAIISIQLFHVALNSVPALLHANPIFAAYFCGCLFNEFPMESTLEIAHKVVMPHTIGLATAILVSQVKSRQAVDDFSTLAAAIVECVRAFPDLKDDAANGILALRKLVSEQVQLGNSDGFEFYDVLLNTAVQINAISRQEVLHCVK